MGSLKVVLTSTNNYFHRLGQLEIDSELHDRDIPFANAVGTHNVTGPISAYMD